MTGGKIFKRCKKRCLKQRNQKYIRAIIDEIYREGFKPNSYTRSPVGGWDDIAYNDKYHFAFGRSDIKKYEYYTMTGEVNLSSINKNTIVGKGLPFIAMCKVNNNKNKKDIYKRLTDKESILMFKKIYFYLQNDETWT